MRGPFYLKAGFMIRIEINPNSSVEEIFAFKCCCIPDQNFEMRLYNSTEQPVNIHSYCDLVKEDGAAFRIQNLFPQGIQKIEPGESIAFYCNFPEELLAQYKELVFYDESGNRHSRPVNQEKIIPGLA